jgi:DNA helicase-2/ATP-dependent DNA helicase PcrA
MDYLEGLNEPQRDAVLHVNGPALVIAGAGSGKTRVLTFRIAHLLKKGVPPFAILALTFTNKAAREMKERIGQVAGESIAKTLWMGTFHSVFAKILRFEHQFIGFPSSFTIYDSADAKNLIKAVVKDLQLDAKIYTPSEVLSRISMAKNNLVTATAYANNQQLQESDRAHQKPFLFKVYEEYAKRCFKSGAMDFDDILLFTNILFRDHAEVVKKYREKFQYLLVDEYQDTNHAQYRIIKELAHGHRNLCVVGDDAQSIYSFRGAKIENILNFRSDYPEYKLFKLEQNYRSTQNIVNAANSIIAKNQHQIQKTTYSEKDEGSKIRILANVTDNEEGFAIAKEISQAHLSENLGFDKFAILYRTNAQSRIMEEALRKRNIPYKIYGGTSFYQRKEIKDVLSYFRLVVNPNDDEAFKRVVNYPKRGIGDASVDKIEKLAGNVGLSIWNTLRNSPMAGELLGKSAYSKMAQFMEFVGGFARKLDKDDAFTLGNRLVAEAGILKDLFESKTPEDISRHQNVQELLNGLKEFSTKRAEQSEGALLSDYMQDVALLTDFDSDADSEKLQVSLMTIHSSKGLEFRNVYLVGMEEDLFPNQMTSKSPQSLEEERRLFYVAVTRAESLLTISYAKSRYKWGKLGFSMPSRFIRDIDSQFVDDASGNEDYVEGSSLSSSRSFSNFKPRQAPAEAPKPSVGFKKSAPSPQPKAGFMANLNKQPTEEFSPSPVKDLKVGIRVLHASFGRGIIQEIEGVWPNSRAIIVFEAVGKKLILLKFAKLKIVE